MEQITRTKGVVRKEKVEALGGRRMRAEGESREGARLPPVTEILSAKSKGSGAVENVKTIVEKKGKKIVSVPAPIKKKMELEGEEVEVDFEREQSNEFRVDLSQEILNEVARNMPGGQEGDETEPVETLSTTFLQSLVSDKMDVDLGEEYDLSIQEIVEDLEQSGREAGLSGSPSRVIKEELIEREEISREGRKVGDGKVSSESTEEVEKIIVEDSVCEENYMVRAVGTESWAQEDEEPAPARDVMTPVMGSIPVKNRDKGEGDYWSHNLKLKPLIAPKKKWVEPERTDERDNISSENESSSSQRSATTERSEIRRLETGDDCLPVVERRVFQGPPRRYGARSTRVRVHVDREAGIQEISAVEDDNTEMTGDDGDGARVVSACSWLEGGEKGRGGDLDVGGDLEDLDDQLFHLIQAVPAPSTIERALRLAVVTFPDRAPWYLRMKISTIILTMRKTAQHILMRSIRNAPAVNPLTAMTVPLDMDVIAQYISSSN